MSESGSGNLNNVVYGLCIDGGGVKGVTAVSFLHKLETNTDLCINNNIGSLFDCYAGSSTGGLIALAIASEQLTATDCKNKLYTQKNIDTIMNKSFFDRILPVQNKPKYDGKGKLKVINQELPDIHVCNCKPAFITTYNLTKNVPMIFKSNSHGHSHVSLRELANATSAAPIYFPPVKMTYQERNSNDPENFIETTDYFIDGGIIANNPAMVLYTEMKRMYPTKNIKILSIGNGYRKNNIDGNDAQNWGAIRWGLNGLLDIIFNSPNEENNHELTKLIGDNFLRIELNMNVFERKQSAKNNIQETLDQLYIKTGLDDVLKFSKKFDVENYKNIQLGIDDTDLKNVNNLRNLGTLMYYLNYEHLYKFFSE